MMQSTGNRLQTCTEAPLGSSGGCGASLPLYAPAVDETQGRAHVHPAGIPVNSRVAAAARTELVATGSVQPIHITLPTPFGIECGCLLVLPARTRRVARHASRLPHLAEISCRSLSAERQAVEPRRINARPEKPIVEPSHRLRRLSSLAAFDVKQLSERQNGTILYPSGEFPDHHGAPQHECG